jgi:hypothetical protein
MSFRRAATRARRGPSWPVLVAMLLASAASSCGREVPAGGIPVRSASRPPQIARRMDPAELFPADLDLVVRVDMARIRSQLGPGAIERLPDSALPDAAKDLVTPAIRRSNVVWFGLRLGDIEAGDRVVVVEGLMGDLEPDARFQRIESTNDDLAIFDRIGPLKRPDTAQIIALGKRAMAFVSAVEKPSVARVLREGPDPEHREPEASGLLSFDLRAGRLPPFLERRFPSIGSILAGLRQARGTAVLVDQGLQLEATIVAKSDTDAARALKFLTAVRDSVEDARYAVILHSMQLEQLEASIRVRWAVPASVVLALVADDAKPEAPSK